MLRQFLKSPVSDNSRTQLVQASPCRRARHRGTRVEQRKRRTAPEAVAAADGLKAEFHEVTLATRFTTLLLWLMAIAPSCVLEGPCMSTDLIKGDERRIKGAFLAKAEPSQASSSQSAAGLEKKKRERNNICARNALVTCFT